MTDRKIEVLKDFFPQSAAKSYHVTCVAGDILEVQWDNEIGTMTHKNGVICFLLEEEIYKYCRELP